MPLEPRVSLVLTGSESAAGAGPRVVWELATRLPPSRWSVSVWLSTAPGMDELADALVAREVFVERIRPVGSRWDWSGRLGTWKHVRRAEPVLLHLHRTGPEADRLTGIARAAGVRHLIVTEHVVEPAPD